MKRLTFLFCLLALLLFGVPNASAQQQIVRASGAVSVALPMTEAVSVLRAERNIELLLRASGGTGLGLDALGDKSVNIALCSRELTPVERANYPAMQFTEIPIGIQLVAMAVSRDVWTGGVHALSASQARAIYEGKITNWREVGGPNVPIKVFMAEPGRGPWEIFVHWIYDELKKAPAWKGTSVKEIRETCNMLEFTPGSFALIPPSFADRENIFPLAVQEDSGVLREPTMDNVLKGQYPLSRPLLMVIDDKPTGAVKVVVDFMTGERGQEMVKRLGYATLAELKAAKEKQ